MTEHSAPIDVGAGWLSVVTFSANGQFLVGGGEDGVLVWRAQDAKRVARMEASGVLCVAVSRDGQRIAGGTYLGHVFVWDTAGRNILHYHKDTRYVNAVDFSPDSSRLVSASSNYKATIWDVETRKQILALKHGDEVYAAKYSPLGDLVATATSDRVRVWASGDGGLLADIPLIVTPYLNTSLVWSNYHLFVVSAAEIKHLDASTGSAVSAWRVPDTEKESCIALPTHGTFIAYSTGSTVTFWDRSTHSLLGQIQHHQNICSIAISSDDRSIAIGGEYGEIRIESLPRTVAPTRDQAEKPLISGSRDDNPPDSTSGEPCIASSTLSNAFQELPFQIDDSVLDVWMQGRLENAEILLTEAVTASRNPTHFAFATRALVLAHMQKWDMAFADAERAHKICPSAVGCIAKGLAHVGNGERYKGYRSCDIAFQYIHPSHITFLLLVKAIVVFMAGEDVDAISRMDDLIGTVPSNSECCVVQAYMYFLVGKTCMESGNYEEAIYSFENARAKLRPLASRALFLISGWKFDCLDFMTRRYTCEALFLAGRISDAVETFHQLTRVLGEEANGQAEHCEWALSKLLFRVIASHVTIFSDFKEHCSSKLRHLGDAAADAKQHQEAISFYSAALSLDSSSPADILIKRSKVYLAVGSCHQALEDAIQVIAIDPSSPWGYEMKHAVLLEAGDHENGTIAFEEMLSKIEQSPDPEVQRIGDRYIRPSSVRAAIRNLVQNTTRRLPRELINTFDGRLYDRKELESVFESSAIFQELVSSTTTRIDYVRIKRAVREYFRYVMLSHTWDDNEPLFQEVKQISVYDLNPSSSRDKLQTFCKVVRDAGLDWAWSDTCCINQSEYSVLQEALVAMFKWYEGSAFIIVYLRGVLSSAQLGALQTSLWSTRSWTLQEYIAAKVVLFYTEDWKLYLDLQLENHKESPEVISEMEAATGVPAGELMALRPGLANIRGKLRLASGRKTTLVEDEAYSLLGIFSASGIPAIYGEGEGALGRLLANVLTRSGDVSVLAWTGEPGPFNTCLPAHVSVFSGPVTSHFPAHILDTEMDTAVAASRVPFFDMDTALRLCDRLRELPTPRFAESRMTLPCMTFQLSRLFLCGTVGAVRTYRTRTDPFGIVEIKTKYDLARFGVLYLVHPWLCSLLEPTDARSGALEDDDPPLSPALGDNDIDDEVIDGEAGVDRAVDDMQIDDSSPNPEPRSPSFPLPVQTAPMDRETRARRLVVRLRQSFGALLFRLTASDQRVQGYMRVAADSLITVRFREDFPLARILVRTVDVL